MSDSTIGCRCYKCDRLITSQEGGFVQIGRAQRAACHNCFNARLAVQAKSEVARAKIFGQRKSRETSAPTALEQAYFAGRTADDNPGLRCGCKDYPCCGHNN